MLPDRLEENQLRQYIDAETCFKAFLAAQAAARQVRGGMVWRESGGHTYLIRTSTTGAQKSLGPRSEQTISMYESFIARKQAAESRLKSLKDALKEHKRLNLALRIGRAPNIVVSILCAIEDAALSAHFLTVGTHALYAYEAAAGARIWSRDLTMTKDIDLFYDASTHLRMMGTLQEQGVSLMGVLRKADKSFQVREDQKQTAVNDKAFEVDIIRRPHRFRDPHPMPVAVAPDEDTLWAVGVQSGDLIDGAGRFDQMVISTNGSMAMMRTIPPAPFVRIKESIGRSATRDTLKRPKDLAQARVVREMLNEGWLVDQALRPSRPATDVDADEAPTRPADRLRGSA